MAASGYREYVADADQMRVYADYQARYAGTLRESDRVLIDLVRAHARPRAALLDVGCSTGNLLAHLAGDGLELHGADLAEEIVAANRVNPALAGVQFHVADMLALDLGRTFDIVTVNAALMFFTPGELRTAVSRLAGLLAPGGMLVGFDFVHQFDQELEIVETSAAYPGGLRMFIRGERVVRAAFAAAGLVEVAFEPFAVPIALERPDDAGDLRSWTPSPGLSLRGSLFQPWCHFTARRPA